MEVSKAKRNGEYDEGGIMKPACGEISFVKQTVRHVTTHVPRL